MDFKKGLNHAIKLHFLPNVAEAIETYELTLQGTAFGEHDVLAINITDTLTNEEVDFEMYAVELAHLVTATPSDWKWLAKGWTATTEKSILNTMSKVLLSHGIDIRDKTPSAVVTYLGNDLDGQPVVRVKFAGNNLFQSVNILHIPVKLAARPVQHLLAIDFSPIKVTTLSGEV